MCAPSRCTDVNPAAAQCTAKTSSCNKVSLQPVITSLVSLRFLRFRCVDIRILVLIKTVVTLYVEQISDGTFVSSVPNGGCKKGDFDIVHSSFILLTGLCDKNISKRRAMGKEHLIWLMF